MSRDVTECTSIVGVVQDRVHTEGSGPENWTGPLNCGPRESLNPSPRSSRVKKKAYFRFPLMFLLLLLSFAALPSRAQVSAKESTTYTEPLPTGVRLDPVGDVVDLGSMPLGMAVAPGANRLAVALSGWREQGVQIVDLKSRKVLQTLTQPSAFFGIVFSRNGNELYVSGGNDDGVSLRRYGCG